MTQTAEGIHLGCGTMEEMLIIPRAEAPDLVQKHSKLLMEDGRLSHAARLAARQERLLTDPTLPDDVAVERVKPVDRQLRRAVKKLRQLQTQPLTAEEEAQEGQELLTPALSKWMRRMVRAVQPDGAAPAPADVTPAGRRRRLLPPTRSDTPRRGKTPTPSGKKRKTPSRIPVPFTPEELRDVPLKPTPARKKTPSSTGPRHLKSNITPESLVSQSARLKKVGPPRTTRQTNPWMASLSREMDKRRRQLDPDRPSTSWELKGLEQQWKTW